MESLKIGNLCATVPIVQGGMGVGVSLSGLASAVAADSVRQLSRTNSSCPGVLPCPNAGDGLMDNMTETTVGNASGRSRRTAEVPPGSFRSFVCKGFVIIRVV